jgi:hypothetical protein
VVQQGAAAAAGASDGYSAEVCEVKEGELGVGRGLGRQLCALLFYFRIVRQTR